MQDRHSMVLRDAASEGGRTYCRSVGMGAFEKAGGGNGVAVCPTSVPSNKKAVENQRLAGASTGIENWAIGRMDARHLYS